jgi:hypothetical protein
MADKPPYKLAHDARKHGEAEMTIEAAPKTSFTDKSLPTPYEDTHSSGSIGSMDNAKPGAKMSNTPVHPGDFKKSPLASDTVRT